MSRIWASGWAAFLAWSIGAALNVPVWRDWQVGDRTDMAMAAFFSIYAAIGSARKATRC